MAGSSAQKLSNVEMSVAVALPDVVPSTILKNSSGKLNNRPSASAANQPGCIQGPEAATLLSFATNPLTGPNVYVSPEFRWTGNSKRNREVEHSPILASAVGKGHAKENSGKIKRPGFGREGVATWTELDFNSIARQTQFHRGGVILFTFIFVMKFTLAFSLLLSSVSSLAVNPIVERDYCPPDAPIVQIFVCTTLVTYPVLINTYIKANTIININGGVTININNAPTNLSTIVTGSLTQTSTSYVTDTATTTVTVPAATSTPFVLQIVPFALQKRQVVNTYVAADGRTTTDGNSAAVFTLQGAQLLSNGELISTVPNTAAQVFAVSSVIGSISTTFAGTNDILSWTNDAFSNGTASFCLFANLVEVIFTASLPSGCVRQTLKLIPTSSLITTGNFTSIPPKSSTFSNSSTTAVKTSTAPVLQPTSTASQNTTLVSSTASSTSSASPTPTAFAIQITGANITGYYARIVTSELNGDTVIAAFPGTGNASIFTLDPAGHLLDAVGDYANQNAVEPTNPYPYALFLNPPGGIQNTTSTLPICSFGSANSLTCAESDGRAILQYCQGYSVVFLDSRFYVNCSVITFTGIPYTAPKKHKRLVRLIDDIIV
ncbi:hypothetical protein BP6252_00588 [Coleophoma cylindrospora]|uniref:DUF7908 domain-containing protein n=1 Tax=Coleophoma cylindrospora TaxID=1849047 RepID=A0A3D8SQG0_9HELO|nr:hypothetical protein BP6252_00588 [Coleophoma cylindrospora]